MNSIAEIPSYKCTVYQQSIYQVRNIHLLTKVLDALASRAFTLDDIQAFLGAPSDKDKSLTRLGQQIAALVNTSQSLELDVELRRGRATIPLTAIDIPFHSNILRPGIAVFRRILETLIRVEDFRPELVVGKWITNVMGKEFSLGVDYFRKAAEVTSSTVLEDIVRQITAE